MKYKNIIVTEGSNLTTGELIKYPERIEKFIAKIQAGQPFQTSDGKQLTIDKDKLPEYQQALDNEKAFRVTGKYADGTEISLPTGKLVKTLEFGGQTKGENDADAATKISNRGNITEGVLGAATLARLAARPGKDITVQDIYSIIGSLPDAESYPTGGICSMAAASGSITDKFNLTVKLAPAHYKDLTNVELLKSDPLMVGIINQIVRYCNEAATVERYAKFFENNNRPDTVEIVSDGVSDNTGRKTDIYMVYVNEDGDRAVKHFDLSLKAGTASQFGQASGGRSDQGATAESFDKLIALFEPFGVDIEPMRATYLKSRSFDGAYGKAYSYATKILKAELKGADPDREQKFLSKFIRAIQFHGTRNDDRVKLLQFEKNKFYLLDFKKLDRLYAKDKINLGARYLVQGNGLPTLEIYDSISGKWFMQIRPKPENGKTRIMRNLIQKGPAMKALLTSRSTKKPVKESIMDTTQDFGPNYNIVDDVHVYMRNDSDVYRKQYFPMLCKMQERLASGKKISAKDIMMPVIRDCIEQYNIKFNLANESSDIIADEDVKSLVKKIYSEEIPLIKKGVYK